MKSAPSTPAIVALGLAITVVCGSGVAAAKSGATLTLGAANKTTSLTTLTGTKGTPLRLKAPAGDPVLAVGNAVKVPHLNADLLDGRDSTTFQDKLSGSCGSAAGNYVNGVAGSTLGCSNTQKAYGNESPFGNGPPTLTVPSDGNYLVFANVVADVTSVSAIEDGWAICYVKVLYLPGSSTADADVGTIPVGVGTANHTYYQAGLGTAGSIHLSAGNQLTLECSGYSLAASVYSGKISIMPVTE